ncbi:ERCC4 nuclease [uncultured archaeal virus]|jgi:ERCC4-type nuclease|uniref:ERCC4 domain-containing protein EP364R n=1 Tax=uncultured archaeal virus TaxID=1960247 RepID=A0A1S5Y2Z3_9VIRU|nr:ERCC4 nuclease [uncultured archaeal virus]
MVIVVDVKEPKTWKAIADKEDNIQVDFLIIGDKRKYAIERKTISDLFSSARNRLWFQLKRLRELAQQGYIPIVLIIGSLGRYARQRKMEPNKRVGQYLSYIGILRGIVNYGCHPVQVSSAEMGKGFLRALNKSAGKETQYERPVLIQKTNRTLEDEALDILMAISGVGHKTAKELLNYFGSVLAVLNASRSELKKILRPSVADHLFDIVRRKIYKSSLDRFIGEKKDDKLVEEKN